MIDHRTTRRGALKFLGLASITTAVAPGVLLQSCREAADAGATAAGYTFRTFSKAQAAAVRIIQDAIIPKTDTPSASEVGSVEFADTFITHAFKDEDRGKMLYSLDRFAARLKDDFDGDVDSATPEQVDGMMKRYFVDYVAPEEDEDQQVEIEGNTVEVDEGDEGRTELGTHAQVEEAVAHAPDEVEINGLLRSIRGLTLESYFQSEEIAENVLNYDEVPGKYIGVLPLSEMPNGRAWSL